MANERVATADETMKLILAKAAEGEDLFSIKVLRTTHSSMPADRIATLSGGVANHLVSPELWIPELAGGGKYKLQAFHVSDPNKPIGGAISFSVEGDVREVDTGATSKSGWRGPAVIDFPQKNTVAPRREDMGYGISSPGPGVSDSASRTTQGYLRVPGGGNGVHRADYDGPGWENTRSGLAAIEGERRRLEEEKLAAERERAKNDREALQKSHEAEMRSLRAELMSEIKGLKSSGPDPMALMFAEMQKQNAEDRRAQAIQAAEDRRAEAARQERTDARFAQMLEKMTDRPKEDPLAMVTKVAELLKANDKGNSNEAQMKVMANFVEMQSLQMDSAMRFIETATDLQLGQGGGGDSPIAKGIESAVKAIGSVIKGSSIKRPVLMPTQIPQQIPAQTQQAPQPQPQAEPVPGPVIDQFIHAIKNYNLPVATVAKALREQIMDPTLQAAFAEADNDFEKLIQMRLGNWANEKPANAQYLVALIAEVKRQFVEAGFIAADVPVQTQAAPAGEEQEEEGEYEEQEQGDEVDDE